MTRVAAPETWEGPTLRTVDIADNMPVMIVTTALRRLWLIEPPELAQTARDKTSGLAREFEFALQANGNYITYPRREVPGSPLHDWSDHVRRMYGHVFWDMYQSLKLEASHIGEFPERSSEAVSLLNIEITDEAENEVLTIIFDRDTFLFPVWFEPSVSVTIVADDHTHSWAPDGSKWTFGIWVRRGVEVGISTKSENSGTRGLGAILAQGHCEQPEKPEAIGFAKDRKPGDPVAPEIATEATHLARAVWLSAGDAANDCRYDAVHTTLDAQLHERRQGVKHLHGPNESRGSLYEKLPHATNIRLLRVAPGDIAAELRTTLVLVDLQDNPEYEALSYTWGDPQDKVQLACASSSVPVPSNLHGALNQLRYHDRPRYVWADAVCINQEDIKERGQQVSIMRDIFHGATRVLVWLGTDQSQQAAAAFKAVCDIVRSWKPPGNKLAYTSYAEAFEPMSSGAREYLHRRVNQNAWAALHSLFSSNYFRRFWIIQELSLSQSAIVVWGKHHIAWPLVGICATWLLSKGWDFQAGAPMTTAFNAFLIYVLPLARHSAITHFSRLDLSAILGITVGIFDSTDPRDRIYALLGMSFSGNDPGRGLLLKPDYTEDLRSVYTRAATRMLQQDQHLRLLSSIQHGATLDPSWPSWVPKWNESYNAEPLALREEQGYYANAGELFFPDDNTFSPDGKSIYLNGLECSPITEVSELMTRHKHGHRAMTREKDRAALSRIMGQLLDEENLLRSSWSSKIEQYTIFGFTDPAQQAEIVREGIRAAAATGVPGKYGIRSSVEMLTGDKAQVDHLGEFLIYWRERSSWRPNELLHISDERMEKAAKSGGGISKEILLCSLNTLWGRRVFHCGDGKLGLGPAAAQPGDRVAVLFGGIVPFVLRPAEGGSWRFVGECFVPGLMQGEAVEAAGLLAPGSFERHKDGTLRLNLEEEHGTGPRFQRKVGEQGVVRFEIR
ncbi:hypothetical protein TruAng_011874 [Truncatella angustata]|nr:hypothetical protein TruAng_011874 [Truncatella angustata]